MIYSSKDGISWNELIDSELHVAVTHVHTTNTIYQYVDHLVVPTLSKDIFISIQLSSSTFEYIKLVSDSKQEYLQRIREQMVNSLDPVPLDIVPEETKEPDADSSPLESTETVILTPLVVSVSVASPVSSPRRIDPVTAFPVLSPRIEDADSKMVMLMQIRENVNETV